MFRLMWVLSFGSKYLTYLSMREAAGAIRNTRKGLRENVDSVCLGFHSALVSVGAWLRQMFDVFEAGIEDEIGMGSSNKSRILNYKRLCPCVCHVLSCPVT